MSNSVAVLSQKGGVGKTTVVLGLASAAWDKDIKTLIVDLDAQANSTWALGVDPETDYLSSADAMKRNQDGSARNMVVHSGWGGSVDLLPASQQLIERDADNRIGGAAKRLKRSLKGVREKYDIILFDCSPSLGLNTINALMASERALLAVEPSIFGIKGVGPVLNLLDDMWSMGNRKLDLAGVVLNKVPAVSSDAEVHIKDLKKIAGSTKVWKPYVPARVMINQVHTDRSPLHSFGYEASELKDIFDKLLKKLLANFA